MPTPDPEQDREAFELHVPLKTLCKVALVTLAAYMLWHLWPLIILIFLACLVAVTLQPALAWLRGHGVAHGISVLIIAVIVFGAIAGAAAWVFPALATEGSAFVQSIPAVRDQFIAQIPADSVFRQMLERWLSDPALSNPKALVPLALSWGQSAIEGLLHVLIILTVAIYLLLDGERVYNWLIAFVPQRRRARIRQTGVEIAPVAFAYVAGQVITSVLCSLFTWAALTWLGVPATIWLAVLAGIFDVLPIIGFFLSIVPAVILAFTVSPSVAIATIVFYIVYNAVETYLIVPMVYGKRLRLPTLTVLISLMAATIIAGIPGAIAVLPLVASYPIIERIWLAEYLGRAAVEEHKEQQRQEEQKAEKKVDDIKSS
jgi:predicted PurR-regulated permease PerM